MGRSVEYSIRCVHCNEWFPSVILFSDTGPLNTARLGENQTQCPHCLETTEYSAKNFKSRSQSAESVFVSSMIGENEFLT